MVLAGDAEAQVLCWTGGYVRACVTLSDADAFDQLKPLNQNEVGELVDQYTAS